MGAPKSIPDSMNKTTHFNKGETLIRENELSRKMFVLKRGKVRVFKTYLGQKITLAILSDGEIFGEMSFFDAKPRSATVEALTEVDVYVVDSEVANQQLQSLPDWVQPIFRTIFNRLRTADMRNTVLQSMNEFEKRHYKKDSIARALYEELLRFNKVLKLVYSRAAQESKGPPRSDTILKGLDEVLGDHFINLQAYWRLLREYDFIDREKEETEGVVVLHEPHINTWIEELSAELEGNRCTLLSHTAVAILKRIVSVVHADDVKPESSLSRKRTVLKTSDLDLESVPLYEEALKEMERLGLIQDLDSQEFSVEPAVAFKTYTYQSLLKFFDHSIQN